MINDKKKVFFQLFYDDLIIFQEILNFFQVGNNKLKI